MELSRVITEVSRIITELSRVITKLSRMITEPPETVPIAFTLSIMCTFRVSSLCLV